MTSKVFGEELGAVGDLLGVLNLKYKIHEAYF